MIDHVKTVSPLQQIRHIAAVSARLSKWGGRVGRENDLPLPSTGRPDTQAKHTVAVPQIHAGLCFPSSLKVSFVSIYGKIRHRGVLAKTNQPKQCTFTDVRTFVFLLLVVSFWLTDSKALFPPLSRVSPLLIFH